MSLYLLDVTIFLLAPTLWWPSTSDTIPGSPSHPKCKWDRDSGITSPYAKTPDCSIFSTPTQMNYTLLGNTASRRNQFIDLLQKSICCFPNVTSHHRKLFANIRYYENNKDTSKTLQYWKPLYILAIHKARLDLALKMIRTPSSFRKVRHGSPKIPSSIKNCTMYKLVHRLVKQVSVLVSTGRGSLLKGTSRQTLVSLLHSHYFVDFIVDLVLVFGVIIRQVVFVTMPTFCL